MKAWLWWYVGWLSGFWLVVACCLAEAAGVGGHETRVIAEAQKCGLAVLRRRLCGKHAGYAVRIPNSTNIKD